MIKNYIFDFGNVIANFVPEDMTKPYVEEKEMIKIVADVVFDRLYWDRLDAGTISDDEIKEDILKRLPDGLGAKACTVYDNWINSMTPVAGMRELILDIKNRGGKIYLLSNISTGFANGYKKVEWINEILKEFDGLIFSGVIKKAKPDREIFEHIIDTYKLNPDECLFIDDIKKNIEGAKSAGINGYLFDGNSEKLRKFIGI